MENLKTTKEHTVYVRSTRSGEVIAVPKRQAQLMTAKPSKGSAKWELVNSPADTMGDGNVAALKGQVTKLTNQVSAKDEELKANADRIEELEAKIEELEELLNTKGKKGTK